MSRYDDIGTPVKSAENSGAHVDYKILYTPLLKLS